MKKLIAGMAFILCSAQAAPPITPNPLLTPGAYIQPPTPLDVLCKPGHSAEMRDVTQATKRQVFQEYGLANLSDAERAAFEVDHLIPLSLDGSNDLKNLWPQSYRTQPLNAHRKDMLELVLHVMVCRHQLDLLTAQHAIATDWVTAYNHYVLHQP
jgi:hypothetical protein